jgi:hypothetical protein
MALSNIFREPRREITETIVGFIAFFGVGGLWLAADLWLAGWFTRVVQDTSTNSYAAAAILVGPLLTGGLVILFHIVHRIGEDVCDALARLGFELRPRRRAWEARSGTNYFGGQAKLEDAMHYNPATEIKPS